MIKPLISTVNGKFSQKSHPGKHFPGRFTESALADIVMEENHMMNNKVSRLGVLFVVVGFFMLCASYIIDNFTYSESGYILALGWYSIISGMLVLAVMGVLYILSMLIRRFTKK